MSTKTPEAATTTKTLFSRTTSVECDIHAKPEVIWALLTDAGNYPTWNSTVLAIDGKIAKGETIRLKSSLDPKRIFKLKIKTFEPSSTLAWGDAMGTRVYTLADAGNGNTRFAMTERIGGPLFPLFARMIPSFDKSFETFAADLQAAAEAK